MTHEPLIRKGGVYFVKAPMVHACVRADGCTDKTREHNLMGDQKSDVYKQTGSQKTLECNPTGDQKSHECMSNSAEKTQEKSLMGESEK